MEWSTSATQLALAFLTIVILDTIRRIVRNRIDRKGYPLPPGPTALPLLGSALSISPKEPWLTYTEWKAKYGNIVYTRLLNTDVVVLNSPSVVTELLEKRSQIYSDRPFIATTEPYGHDCNFVFSRYGEHWRLCRRIFHQSFRAEASVTLRPMQLRRARQMILNMIDDPEEYPFHCSLYSAGIAMSSVYDYEIKPQNDPIVSIINRFLHISFPALTPEKAVILEAFPFLLYIPDWLPGSWIKREAREAATLRNKMIETPFQYVRKRMESRDNRSDAMVFDHLTRMEQFDGSYRIEYEAALKYASITAFIGSAETTSSTIMTFTLAMVKNPRVWKCAQAEIDAVVGIDRLPEFEHRNSLPYVDAIMRETFRWKLVAPLGVPHATISNNIYNGFYIPKGATIIPNVWGMFYDEARYPNPEVFSPERFLDTQGFLTKDNPGDILFGFGRRACPGRHVADASIWSAIVTMLATLEFNAGKDEDGKDVVFEATFTSGLTVYPTTFPCRLTPRAHINKEVLKNLAQ
ncbi:cytochrome P450 [Boletus coccyginus]|nr:cytochrome P450 [Boletus coccyginus]